MSRRRGARLTAFGHPYDVLTGQAANGSITRVGRRKVSAGVAEKLSHRLAMYRSSENYPHMRMTIMEGKVTFGRFWIRGLWVFLMFLLTNIFLGAVAAAVGRLSRSVPGLSLWISYLLVMLVVGLPFMGWIFEQFASRLPRLLSSESRSSVPT